MWTFGRIGKTVSDATIGTAIVIVHVAMADRLELRRRTGRTKPSLDERTTSSTEVTG